MEKLIRLLIQPHSTYFWICLLLLRILLTVFSDLNPPQFFVRNNSAELEFPQTIHPPYLLVYGDTHLNDQYLMWEWKGTTPLRSTFLTFINAWPFAISKLLGFFYSRIYWVLFVQHSLFIFLGDYWFYELAVSLFKGNPLAIKVSFFFYIFNSSSLFLSQQISNNAIETVLLLKILNSVITLQNHQSTFKPYLKLAALLWLSFIIRPSAVISYVPIVLLKIYESQSFSFLWKLITAVVLLIHLFFFALMLDSLFYGRFVVTAWHFFHVNMIKGVASQFGKEPFYTAFTYYLPFHFKLLTLFLPAAFFHYLSHCVYFRRVPYLLATFLFTLVLFGLVPHKEERFILPILPLGYLMLGLAFADFLEDNKDKTALQLYLFLALVLEITFFQAFQSQYQALSLIEDFSAQYLQDVQKQTSVGLYYSYSPGPFLPLIHPKQEQSITISTHLVQITTPYLGPASIRTDGITINAHNSKIPPRYQELEAKLSQGE